VNAGGGFVRHDAEAGYVELVQLGHDIGGLFIGQSSGFPLLKRNNRPLGPIELAVGNDRRRTFLKKGIAGLTDLKNIISCRLLRLSAQMRDTGLHFLNFHTLKSVHEVII